VSAQGAQGELARVQVLLLTPTRSQSPVVWAEIARGLRQAGLWASEVADVRIDPVFAACSQPECARRAALAARMPGLLCIWPGPGQALELRWFESDGRDFSARTQVGAGGLRDAIAGLANQLQRQRTLGERALLRVESTPPGALVRLDGHVAGVTPLERECEPGAHEVRVVLDGVASPTRRIELRAGEWHVMREALPAQVASGTSERASPANTLLAAALTLGAAPMLVAASNSLIDDGQCLESDVRGCTRWARVDGVDVALLVAGIASVGLAAYLFVVQPLRLEVQPRERSVSLSVRSAF